MHIALMLRKLGFNSDIMHGLGLTSIIASIAFWGRSASAGDWKEKARAERFAIFVGLWPPTFFLLGKVLQDLERSPTQQALKARGVDDADLDAALQREATATTTAA